MIKRWLFTHIDNSALIIFRIIFGFLIAAEAIGSIFTGWIKRTLIEPNFTFNFLGLDFLQPLPGNGMYFYYLVMGIIGLLIMVGYRYRWSMIAYTIMWAGVYFMQKTSYNNHYYLLLLLCFMMCFLPAAGYLSWDAKHKGESKISMPRWCSLVIIIQLTIVYTYASVAKLYPDWLDFTVARNLMAAKRHYYIIGDILQHHWAHVTVAYMGILFDLLIIPLLLWRRTRVFAFCISIFFHMFNSIVLQVGIFPYLSLAFSLFFFSKERIHNLFLKRKPFYDKAEVIVPNYQKPLTIGILIWFVIQVGLPLRHWAIPGDVLWTEEGHRLSWRMMLRGRTGYTRFYIVDKNDPQQKRTLVNTKDYLSKKQHRTISNKPDAMWQFAQRLREEYAQKGKDIAVYVDSKVSINGKKSKVFIDPKVDLASAPWNYFTTNPWIIKYPKTDDSTTK